MSSFTILLSGFGIIMFCVILYILFRLFSGIKDTSPKNRIKNPYYFVYKEKVLYRNQHLLPANPSSFLPYDTINPFGHDNTSVFYKQYSLEGAEIENFQILGKEVEYFYSTDGNRVFINHSPIEGVDSESFQLIPHSAFSMDKNFVYYKGKKVKGAQVSTFELLQGKYARDAYHYYFGKNSVLPENIPHNILNPNQTSI